MRRRRQLGHLGPRSLRALSGAWAPFLLAAGFSAAVPATPSSAVTLGLPRWAPAWSAFALDVDGDGSMEVAAVSHKTVPIWFRGLPGRFAPASDDPWHGERADRHGMAPCDVDRDGRYDIVVGSGGGRGAGGSAAELHLRDATGAWVDRGQELLAASEGARMRGVSCVDLNADGQPEIWLYAYGDRRANLVFQRQADGSFRDIAAAIGVGEAESTFGAQFADLDGDGDLDVVRQLESRVQVLLQGADGVFTSTHQDFGLRYVRDLELVDVDGDLDADLVVARSWNGADGAGDGSFQFELSGDDVDSATYLVPNGCERVTIRARGSFDGDGVDIVTGEGAMKQVNRVKMSSAYADKPQAPGALLAWVDPKERKLFVEASGVQGQVNGRLVCGSDRNPDVPPKLIESALEPIGEVPDHADTLWLNDGTGHFLRAELPQGPAGGNTADIASLDVDLDGDMDLLLVTEMAIGTLLNEPDWLLENDGTGNFTPSPSFQHPEVEPLLEGAVAVVTDLNRDHFPDLLIFNGANYGVLGGELQYWINPHAHGSWVEVDVFDRGGVARSLSAEIEVRVASHTTRRLSNPTPDYRANGGQLGVFGLNGARAADQITVRWPDGASVVLTDVRAGQTVRVVHPE